MVSYAIVCGLALFGVLRAEVTAVYDPNVMHYGDYIKLTYQLTDSDGKALEGTGPLYLTADDDGNPGVETVESPRCFWMVLPENGKSLDTVYAQEVAPNEKIRFEHVLKGGRLYLEDGALVMHKMGIAEEGYSLSDESSSGEMTLLANGALMIGSECKLRVSGEKLLGVVPGMSFDAKTDEGAKLGVIGFNKFANWRIDDVYPITRIMKTTADKGYSIPSSVVLSYDRGIAEHWRYSGKVPGARIKLMDKTLAFASNYFRFCRVADSRFFAVTSSSAQWAYLCAHNKAAEFIDKEASSRAQWVLLPDNDGFLRMMSRSTGAYLCYPGTDWSDNSLWLTMDNESHATFDDSLAFVSITTRDLFAGVIVSDDASKAVYDPVEDAPLNPIFNAAWELPIVGKGNKNTIEFSMTMQEYNDLDKRQLRIAISEQTKALRGSMIDIYMSKDLFEISSNIPNKSLIKMAASERDSSVNPMDNTLERIGTPLAGSKMITTRVKNPEDPIKFVIDLYAPEDFETSHISIKKIDASGEETTFEIDDLQVSGNTLRYFGFAGAASKIMFSDIKINGERKGIEDASLDPVDLVNLSESHKANPGEVLLHRVAVGSRPMSVDGELKGKYISWAVGAMGTDYENKLYEWKTVDGVGQWVKHEAMLQSEDEALAKTEILGFTDISVSDDGKVFACAGGNLYRYNWPVTENANGTWTKYQLKNSKNEEFTIKQVAVGRTKVVDVDVKNDAGKTTKQSVRKSALYVVAQESDNNVRVYQSKDASNHEAEWVSRGRSGSDVMIATSAYDVVLALNDGGAVLARNHDGGAEEWNPLFMNLIIKTKSSNGSEVITKESIALSYIAVGGADLIFGVVEPTFDRPERILVGYSKDDQGWITIDDESGKDMSGVVSLSVNQAGSTMMIDAEGSSYRSEEMGVTLVVPTPSGDTVTATSADKEDVKTEVAAEDAADVKTTEVKDEEDPAKIATEETAEQLDTVTPVRGRRSTRSRPTRGVGMPRGRTDRTSFGVASASGRGSRRGSDVRTDRSRGRTASSVDRGRGRTVMTDRGRGAVDRGRGRTTSSLGRSRSTPGRGSVSTERGRSRVSEGTERVRSRSVTADRGRGSSSRSRGITPQRGRPEGVTSTTARTSGSRIRTTRSDRSQLRSANRSSRGEGVRDSSGRDRIAGRDTARSSDRSSARGSVRSRTRDSVSGNDRSRTRDSVRGNDRSRTRDSARGDDRRSVRQEGRESDRGGMRTRARESSRVGRSSRTR